MPHRRLLPGLAPPHAPDAPALDVEQRIALHRAVAETVSGSWLNSMWRSKPFEPSCAAGACVKLAVSGTPGTAASTASCKRPPAADAHRVRLGAGPYRKPRCVTSPKPVRRDRHLPGGVSRPRPSAAQPSRAHPSPRAARPRPRVACVSPSGTPPKLDSATVNAVSPSWPVGTSSNLTLRPGAAPRIARCQRAVVREQRIDPAPGASDGPAIEGEAVRRHRHVAVRAVS